MYAQYTTVATIIKKRYAPGFKLEHKRVTYDSALASVALINTRASRQSFVLQPQPVTFRNAPPFGR